jgi:hypothetical protein
LAGWQRLGYEGYLFMVLHIQFILNDLGFQNPEIHGNRIHEVIHTLGEKFIKNWRKNILK